MTNYRYLTSSSGTPERKADNKIDMKKIYIDIDIYIKIICDFVQG
jgi:hypothetical protein